MRLNTGPWTRPSLGARSLGFFSVLALLLCVAGALQLPPAHPAEAPGPPSADSSAAPAPSPSARAGRRERSEASDPDAPGPGAQYVGSAFCGAPACHGAMMADFRSMRHSHYVSDPQFKDAAGCEICHGPASNHVADPQKRHIYRFAVQSAENARRINEACLSCHQQTVNRTHFRSTEHARVGVSCASCHEVHYPLDTPYLLRYPGVAGPAGRPLDQREWQRLARPVTPTASPPAAPTPTATAPGTPGTAAPRPRPMNQPKLALLAKTHVPLPSWRTSFTREPGAVTQEQAINELCASCHRRELTEARQFSHHPLYEGRISCTDCHDPHRAVDGRMLRGNSIEETCFQCHEQRRGPFVYEHEPVKTGGVGDSCLECHRPHGSPNRKLTVLFSRGLCVQCHVDIQHDPAHRARGGDCWRSGCHVAIHGSNHSPLFFVQ